jgi:hypothetical protein
MYFPRNWEFGSALSKLRNFEGGGLNTPNPPPRNATVTENSTSSWTLIYSVLFTTMLAVLLCRLDMERNTIWYPTDGVIIVDSVFSEPNNDESCSLAVCEQSWYESDPDTLQKLVILCSLDQISSRIQFGILTDGVTVLGFVFSEPQGNECFAGPSAYTNV